MSNPELTHPQHNESHEILLSLKDDLLAQAQNNNERLTEINAAISRENMTLKLLNEAVSEENATMKMQLAFYQVNYPKAKALDSNIRALVAESDYLPSAPNANAVKAEYEAMQAALDQVYRLTKAFSVEVPF